MKNTSQATAKSEDGREERSSRTSPSDAPAWKKFNPPEPAESPETHSDAHPRVLNRGNETDLYPEEETADNRGRLKRLRKHNRDIAWRNRADVDISSQVDPDLKTHLMQALGGQLKMPKHVVYRATRRMLSIDARKEGLPSGVIGFCIYVHLHDRATEEYEKRTQRLYHETPPGKGVPYWPTREEEENDEQFQRVADSLISTHRNVTEGTIQGILQRLQSGGLSLVVRSLDNDSSRSLSSRGKGGEMR